MERRFLVIGAALALTAVIAGAFGAHALEDRLDPRLMATFETGVRYQMYHALAVIVVASLHGRLNPRALAIAGWFFVAGVLLFSGSLYMLIFTDVRLLGAITPFGGVALLAGWTALLIAGLRRD
jgi:uncharacterized membrane protein YgdD (TMEM256/DUF423 family)